MPTAAPSFIDRRRRDAAVLAVAYFATAALTLQLTRVDGGFAIVWPAGAVLFSALVTTPRRHWRPLVAGCLIAGTFASTWLGFGRGVALPLAAISVAEAVGAAWLLKRLCRRFGRYQSVEEVGWFIAVAGILAPAGSALLGAWFARMAGGLPFGTAFANWYAAHALGFITFAPPIVLGRRGEVARWRRATTRRSRAETAALLGAVAAACAITFGQNAVPLVILPMLPMLAATFRLGRFGAVASIVILMASGLPCSLAGFGPTTLLATGMAVKLQVLQFYFAVVVTILLPVAAELSARRRLVERLRAAEALHRLVLDRTGDVVMRLSREGVIRYASPAVEQVYGYRPDELWGRSALTMVDPEDLPAVTAARARALADADGAAVMEYRIRRQDGNTLWVESHIRATTDEDGRVTGTVSILREITERRHATEELARRAATDPLTGLCNRRAFDEALARSAASATPGSASGCLALFDLDHFKRVNDRFGHAAGDEVLKRFAAVLRASVRDGDMPARLGGEEFALLLPGATLEQAHTVCERIRVRLAATEMTSPGADRVRVTVSAGLVEVIGGRTAHAVLADADAALYRAKSEGRNRLALAA